MSRKIDSKLAECDSKLAEPGSKLAECDSKLAESTHKTATKDKDKNKGVFSLEAKTPLLGSNSRFASRPPKSTPKPQSRGIGSSRAGERVAF